MNIDKDQQEFLLKKNHTFCMLPWVHITTTPTGYATPCCVADEWHKLDIKLADHISLQSLINAQQMKDLRLDMLNERKNRNCKNCYVQEQHNVASLRQRANGKFGKFFTEAIANTEDDGYINDFKLRYYDFRLNNICNMKCRTCYSVNSSLWEAEDAQQGKILKTKIKEDVKDLFIREVVNHIKHLDEAYFAGGEPLLMEEHYEILEELVRLGRTDIRLRYNTNVSVLKFKDKNVLDLWNKFDNKVSISASLDHYGNKAEYIRHGTNWDNIVKNMELLKNHPNVSMSVNTVLSVFNFLTLPEFYYYMIDKGWLTKDNATFSIYMMANPAYLSTQLLPQALKDQGLANIDTLIAHLEGKGFVEHHMSYLKQIRPWVTGADTHKTQIHNFKAHTNRIDNMRSENFLDTFPELSKIFD